MKDWFNSFQKSIQKWKFSSFLTIPTHFKALNEIIFIFLIYSLPSGTRWCPFHKNPTQKNFDKNHWISPNLSNDFCLHTQFIKIPDQTEYWVITCVGYFSFIRLRITGLFIENMEVITSSLLRKFSENLHGHNKTISTNPPEQSPRE